MKPMMAVILAGGEGERLSILSSVRAKPAVPFGGKYRIIDFTLSNCVNSGIDDVVVLTQYNPRSLNDHSGLGRPWDLDRNTGGVRMLQPYIIRRFGEPDDAARMAVFLASGASSWVTGQTYPVNGGYALAV